MTRVFPALSTEPGPDTGRRTGDRPGDRRIRVLVRVTGLVQGVSFRPFVYRVAGRLGLAGAVRNASGGVEIEDPGLVLETAVEGRRTLFALEGARLPRIC